MMTAWCMFDNHTFARIELGGRETISARVRSLFDRRMGASLFVRDASDASLDNLTFHQRKDTSDADIEAWIDRLMIEVNFERLMNA